MGHFVGPFQNGKSFVGQIEGWGKTTKGVIDLLD
jgi:hypothetical protein